ncbi:MAG: acetylornithine transaminase [Actinomycetota bacterium]
MSTSVKTLAEREAITIMPTYKRYPVTFVSGQGSTLYDDHGKEYLDFAAGIAVAQIGHSHPRWVTAVGSQAGRLAHVSNLFYTEPQVMLAEKLTEVTGMRQVFFCNSGAEANEAALKLARRVTGRTKIVAALGGFHGRTFATLAATGQPEKHIPFEPLPDWFTHVVYGDADALRGAVTDDTAAVILEPVLGEGGVIPAPDGYLHKARDICDAAGTLLIVDEVQTGMGRCGSWLATQLRWMRPDIVTLAKGLAGGLPIGACLSRKGISFAAGEHASTFGGGPVVCAAALAVIEVIEREGLLTNARERGAQLLNGLKELRTSGDVGLRSRGLGLLVGTQLFGMPADPVVRAALDQGLVLTAAGQDVVRFTPPLIVTEEEVDEAIARFSKALEAVR